MISGVMPLTLMSIWIAVTPSAGARDLEVHVAERIFHALDVRENGVAAGLSVGDQDPSRYRQPGP